VVGEERGRVQEVGGSASLGCHRPKGERERKIGAIKISPREYYFLHTK
jgi:hypothetical protein